ncbi:MAG: DUF1194 domain-containing protein [Alphaproteobacteria bacterium]|nr:DUF1194 domain-containing protein [Alphaproteobacteria bacterium]
MLNTVMLRWLCVFLSLAFLSPLPAAAQQKVDLELILMADGSGSIDEGEFLLQRGGYARALRHPRVLRAIRSGALGRIALSYVEWSGHFLQVPIVPWTVIRSKADIEAFAQKLEKHPRQLQGGGTAVGSAILYGATSIRENAFEGTRRVIDLSGDGPDKDGVAAMFGRDQAVAEGITVNGLPILSPRRPTLDVFFMDNVIGGPGAFSIPARGFKDFYSAILTKLIREIAARREPAPPRARAARESGGRAVLR